MNDKRQLAAMGEHMAEQPMCMAKRIEELEAQVRVMAELLRDLREGIEGEWCFPGNLDERIDAALAGKLPALHVPEGWQLVPVEPTSEMIASCDARFIPRIALPVFVAAYKTMLSAAPKPEVK